MKTSADISNEVAAFLARGGEIRKCAHGATGAGGSVDGHSREEIRAKAKRGGIKANAHRSKNKS